MTLAAVVRVFLAGVKRRIVSKSLQIRFLPSSDDVLKKYPEAVQSLLKAFGETKRICREFYADPNWWRVAWGRQAFEEKLLGPDPWSYGLKKNRATLERFVSYSPDQRLMVKKMAMKELFLPLN